MKYQYSGITKNSLGNELKLKKISRKIAKIECFNFRQFYPDFHLCSLRLLKNLLWNLLTL